MKQQTLLDFVCTELTDDEFNDSMNQNDFVNMCCLESPHHGTDKCHATTEKEQCKNCEECLIKGLYSFLE